jgi:hypothetical protein
MQMKKFVAGLFATCFIFMSTSACLFAETDQAAIEKAKTEAEAKEIKRQAFEETKKIKEEVKDMKKKALADEDIVKKSAAQKKKN